MQKAVENYIKNPTNIRSNYNMNSKSDVEKRSFSSLIFFSTVGAGPFASKLMTLSEGKLRQKDSERNASINTDI